MPERSGDTAIAAWALAAGRGDRAALAAFVRATQRDVHRFVAHQSSPARPTWRRRPICRHCGALPSFAGRSSGRTWLLSIARHTAADAARAANAPTPPLRARDTFVVIPRSAELGKRGRSSVSSRPSAVAAELGRARGAVAMAGTPNQPDREFDPSGEKQLADDRRRLIIAALLGVVVVAIGFFATRVQVPDPAPEVNLFPHVQEFRTGPIGAVHAVATAELDGRPVVVAGGENATVAVWDLATHAPIGQPFTGHTGAVLAIAIAQLDGRPVVVSGSRQGQRRR